MIPLVARGIASLAGRMITRNPRLGKNIFDLLKRPKGITVFRGEPKSRSTIKDMAKWMYGPGTHIQSNTPLRAGAAGRWFTDEPKFAARFAGYTGPFGSFPGRIKKVTLSAKELKLAKKLSDKIHAKYNRPGYNAAMVISKKALARAKTDHVQTLINDFYKTLGIYRGKDGGLARILNV